MKSNYKKVSIPFWKKLASWIYPFNIETFHSEYSNKLEVNIQYGILVIDTGNANYSYGNLHFVFQEALSNIIFSKEKNYKVLILGFGGGSIANILINELHLNCNIQAVEIDEKIIEISKKYFDTNIFNKTKLHIGDALEFLANDKDTYDLVFVDLFIDTTIAPKFQTINFLNLLKRATNSKGHIFMNSMQNTDELFDNWKKVFKQQEHFSIQENKVLNYFKLK